SGARRGRGIVGAAAAPGADRAGAAPGAARAARPAHRHRRLVDAGPAEGLQRRQPAVTGGEPRLARVEHRAARLALALAAGLVEAFDDRRDFRAAQADIGERAIVERAQLGIGALAAAPLGKGLAGPDQPIDGEHDALLTVWCSATCRRLVDKTLLRRMQFSYAKGQCCCRAYIWRCNNREKRPRLRRTAGQERSMKAGPERRQLAQLLAAANSPLDVDATIALVGGVLAAPEEIGNSWHALVADPTPAPLAAALDALRDGLGAEDFARLPRPARLGLLREELARRGLAGFIVPRADEYQGEYVPRRGQRLAWLTGFTGSAGMAVVLSDRAALFVDGRYTLQ